MRVEGMKIIIEPHTLEQAKERGATEQEINETILDGERFEAKRRCFLVIDFFMI